MFGGIKSDFQYLLIWNFKSIESINGISLSKQNSPRMDATAAASHLGLYCLAMSHKYELKQTQQTPIRKPPEEHLKYFNLQHCR